MDKKEEANRRLDDAIGNHNIYGMRDAFVDGACVDNNLYGSRPLHTAAGCGNIAAIPLLLARGADVNGRGLDGETPLYLAVTLRMSNSVKALVANGADVNAKTNEGDTPLRYARKHGYTEVLDLLKKSATYPKSHAGRIGKERKDKGPPQVG